MENYLIVTDATCDLPEEYVRQSEVIVLPMLYTIGGTTYKGTPEDSLDAHAFYNQMRAGQMPKTAQITPQEFEDYFADLIDRYEQDILYLAFSSALSGTCGSAKIAADNLSQRYPERHIVVIDTLQASLGEGMVVHYALEMKKQGMGFEELVKWIEEERHKICAFFTVNDLHHLQRGGRVSKATAIVGSMLGIKPVLHVDEEGRLIPIGKVRGRKASLLALVDNMQQRIQGLENPVIFVGHGDCKEDADFVVAEVKKRFGMKSFLVDMIGTVIGTHSGPGTVALFFRGNKR